MREGRRKYVLAGSFARVGGSVGGVAGVTDVRYEHLSGDAADSR